MNQTILNELAEYAAERVKRDMQRASKEELISRALSRQTGTFRFENALKKGGLSLICEIKKASPSKGVIDAAFPYIKIAQSYESGGADALSCLTEPRWFMGSDEIFEEIRTAIRIPMLRKDFTVDDYQIYQAFLMGADAVLLICTLLDTRRLQSYLAVCDRLGITALVETHNEEEIKSALKAGARVIGVNNRNLKDFTVDISNAARLRERIPSDKIFVAESGVASLEDVNKLKNAGADAVLVGEFLMRSKEPAALLGQMRAI